MAVLTLAGLTIREAMRKWLFVAGLLIALLFLLLAFIHIPTPRGLEHDDLAALQDFRAKSLSWLGCGMIKFFSSILAITLSAGAISAEVEKGVLSSIVPKPLSRSSVYLGKWLGILILMAACLALWGTLLALTVWIQTHIFHPRIFLGVLTVGLFPLMFITLTLFFSSFATYALSAGLALIVSGVALTENILLFLAKVFDADVLKTLSRFVGYLVPLGKMNHWITKGLGNAGTDMSVNFMRFVDPTTLNATPGDLIYTFFYIAAFLAAGLFVFQRRDL